MPIMKTPRSLDLLITSKCNLSCSYCSHFGSSSDVDRELGTEEWCRFVGELGRYAVMDVCLTGGEPFLRKDLRTILNEVVRNRMRFTILSNGTLIDEEAVSFLASTGRCNRVQVSVDGSCPATHDVFRGKGTFSKAVTGIKLLMKHGVNAGVRVTVHKRNLHDLENISRLLLEELGLAGFSTNAASPRGRCRNNAEHIVVTMEERFLAMEKLSSLRERYGGRISAEGGPLAEAMHLSKIEQMRMQGVDALPGGGYLSACGGVMTKMAIRADGVMIPCSQMPHMDLGRINRDDLQNVWLHSPELNHLRQRANMALSSFEYCRGCEYINYCTGGCPALAHNRLGDAWHPSPECCFKDLVRHDGDLPIHGL